MPDVALTALTVSSALAVGGVMALLGSLKLALARRPEHGEARVRNLLSLLNLLLIPLVVASGLGVDGWGVQACIIAGSVTLALAFLALSAGLPYERTLLAVLAAAIGAALLHVATVVQIPHGLFGFSEVAASFQLGLIFFGLGGLLMPPLFDLLLHAVGHRRTMAILAFLFLVPAFLAAVAPLERPQGVAHLADMALNPQVLLAGAVFFVYAPLEAFVSVWVATYLGNLGQPHKQSRWLACFWLAMLSSRLAFAVILHVADLHDRYLPPFLILPALLAAVILGNMSGTPKHDRALSGLVFLGLFLGPVYPMLLGILFKMRQEEMQVHHLPDLFGSTYALLYVFGSVGSLLLSPLVQLSARRLTIQAALRIPLFIALVLAAATLVFALLSGIR
jgi:hypothetical protein